VTGTVVVAGLGEVGGPLLELASSHVDAVGVDLTPPPESRGAAAVLHVCYPFEIADFVGETERYIDLFRPRLTIIHSTVAVGTTRAVHERTRAPVAHSPVRGKHTRMLADLQRYTKFIGGIDSPTTRLATEHLEALGFQTQSLSSPEAAELAKLTETTYFGLLIAWAQEVERYCDSSGQDYDEVVSFYDEIGFFPQVRYFPGVIGGHCVMPNIEILRGLIASPLLEAIESSNAQKIERDRSQGTAPEPAVTGRPTTPDRPNG
jgi:UDP-N-acetyl-D-mannosaminuronate dehydrogenase